MRMVNVSGRSLQLSPSLTLQSGQKFDLAVDARHIVERPLIKSYIDGGDIVLEGVEEAKSEEAKPAAKKEAAKK